MIRASILSIWKIFKSYYWILVIPVFIFYYFVTVSDKKELSKSSESTYAKVNYSSSIYKKYSKRSYHYGFYVNGKKYDGSSSASVTEGIKTGNFYQVKFAKNNPSNNEIDFSVQYYQIIRGFGTDKVDTSYIEVSKYKIDSVDLNNRLNRVKTMIKDRD